MQVREEMMAHLNQLRQRQGTRQNYTARQMSITEFVTWEGSAASTGRLLEQHEIHPSQLQYIGFDRLRVPAQHELPGIKESKPDNGGK